MTNDSHFNNIANEQITGFPTNSKPVLGKL